MDIHWAKRPSGDTAESDSEDTRQSRYAGLCHELDKRLAASSKSKPKEELKGELKEKLLVQRRALNYESSDASIEADVEACGVR